MRRMTAVVIFFFIAVMACSKKSTPTAMVQYQVTATNSANIDINYTNVAGQKIQVSAKDTWTSDKLNPPTPFTAHIQASSAPPLGSVTTTCTVNILVNGTIAKTATASSNTLAVAEAEFVAQ